MRVLVTGASGWIGSAVVPELIDAGHEVTGLARSEASAAALAAVGAKVQRGDLDDLDVLASAASASDGIIHLAFKHDLAFAGDVEGALGANRRAIEAIGETLSGSGRPFVIPSGVLGLAPGRVATEEDGRDTEAAQGAGLGPARLAAEQAVLGLASSGVRSSAVRIAPTCHGEGDHGFMAFLVGIARAKGVSGYLGDGSNRWPAVHRYDTARLFRLALEDAPAGSALHAVGEEGVAIRGVAEVIGRHLDVPVAAVAPEEAAEHFGFLAPFIGLDSPTSSVLTRARLGWQPAHPSLLEDLDDGSYFESLPR
ncbi:MAG: SDR family oxidoreductase [Acidimicrobiales bacterium]